MSLDLLRANSTTRPSLVRWLAVLFAGSATLGAWLLVRPALDGDRYYGVGYNSSAASYTWAFALLFVPYALVLLAWWRGARTSVGLLLGGAIALHVLVLFAPPPQSQDFYQYLFYGRMHAVHGANPYVVPPDTFWADPWFPWTRWHGQTSVYGPAWMLVSAAVARFVGTHLVAGYVALKLVVLALDVSIMAMIVRGTGDTDGGDGRPSIDRGWGLLVYAWNPLVLMTVPLGGAADVAVAASFVGAILARKKGRTALTTVLLAVAALVKIYAAVGLLLHLVLVFREHAHGSRARTVAKQAGVAMLVGALLYAPYWSGLSTFSGLGVTARITNPSAAGAAWLILIRALHAVGVTTPYVSAYVVRVIAGAVLVAFVARGIRDVRDDQGLWEWTALSLMAFIYLTPWFLFWYALGPLAIVAVLPRNRLTLPVIAFSATSLITLPAKRTIPRWSLLSLLRYGPPALIYRATGKNDRVPLTAPRLSRDAARAVPGRDPAHLPRA